MPARQPPRLISGLRAFFGALRFLMWICLIASPLGLIPYKHVHFRGMLWFPTTSVLNTSVRDDRSPTVRVEHAWVSVDASEDAELSRLHRYIETPFMACLIVASLVMCHLAWRLFRNVEAGDVFSSSNLALLRKLGWTLILYAAVYSAFAFWRDERLSAYIGHHASALSPAPMKFPAFFLHLDLGSVVLGISMKFHAIFLHLDLGGVVLGLLTLVFAEVFRYGLELKRDTEFTV